MIVNQNLQEKQIIIGAHYDIHSAVQNWREKLAEYLAEYLARPDTSTYKIAARAEGFGFKLNASTVTNIKNRINNDVGIETIRAIAKGMGVPEREIFTVVLGAIQAESAPSIEEMRALEYLKGMPKAQKLEAVAILETIWRLHSSNSLNSTPIEGEQFSLQPTESEAVMSTGKPRPPTKSERRRAQRDIEAARADARADQARRKKK
jgi:transcriptional regulator with XRE-family HTH domain